jgi:hypothetical protein
MNRIENISEVTNPKKYVNSIKYKQNILGDKIYDSE